MSVLQNKTVYKIYYITTERNFLVFEVQYINLKFTQNVYLFLVVKSENILNWPSSSDHNFDYNMKFTCETNQTSVSTTIFLVLST